MYNNSEDEISAKCIHCEKERVIAYWDEELEYYIYLSDEPPVCVQCLPIHNPEIALTAEAV